MLVLIFTQSSLLSRSFVLFFYIYGSIPFALIFTYLASGEIIHKIGTRNVGVANAFWGGGLAAGFSTVIGETSKALLPLIVSYYYFDGDLTVSLAFTFAAIIGTNFSVFLKGKGGLGRTILIWALLAFAPISAILLGAIWLVIYRIGKDSYYSSILNNFLIPVVLLPIEQNIPLTVFGLSTATLFFLNYDRSRDDIANFKATNKFRDFFAKNGYIVEASDAKGVSQVGGKANKLGYLRKKGFRIPATYVCTFRAYEEYLSGNDSVLEKLEKEIENLIDSNRKYSVRSSANLEDATSYSFAGQFKSYLNMKGRKPIMRAIERIWQSARGDRVKAYLTKIGKSGEKLKMAVIVQEMIAPELSCVVFTKNPINGMDEVVVESVYGSGDTLVQDGITPDRWVYKWGEWIEKPEDTEGILPAVSRMVLQAKEIAKRYGKPVNLECVYDGKEIYWLQLREITTLKDTNLYSNKISKEFMPGIIKPLIWSVNIPVVNSSWKRLFVELIGEEARSIDIDNMAKSFYYRSYFNMGVVGDIFELLGMPRESVELLMGIQVAGSEKPKFKPGARTLKYLPRMMLFAIRKSTYSKEIERFLATQKRKYDSLNLPNKEKLNMKETLGHIEELIQANKETSYFVIITQLLMGFYNMTLKRQLEKRGLEIEKIDFGEVTERTRDIDPNYHLSILRSEYDALPEDEKAQMHVMSYQDFSKSPEMRDFSGQIKEFLGRFGHLSDSGNDFSTVTWGETPEIALTMIAGFKKPEGEKAGKVDIYALFRSPIKDIPLKFLFKKAVRFREYRERMTFLYTYGYGLFRPYFLHLAKFFVENGFIGEEQDIFYLKLDEIKRVSKLGIMPVEYKNDLEKRKEEVVKYEDIVLPGLICGDAPPPPLTKSKLFTKLKGLGVSKGYCEGRIKVVKGMHDFHKIREGDILVIPYSDVSWTPLFGRAKAVISDSGGMLSHCSTVAREYNIPAVVSVHGALELKDGTMVAVDGYSGEVLILDAKRHPSKFKKSAEILREA